MRVCLLSEADDPASSAFLAQAHDDTIGLRRTVRELLRDETFATGRGANEAALIFVDDEDFPGGIKPTTGYTVEGTKVTLTLRSDATAWTSLSRS